MRTRSANPAPAAAAQPATATPLSSSRLPPEVISHIQRLAEEDEPPSEIKKLRASFELVNKEWYNMVDYFGHIVITRLSDVTKLTTMLRSSKLRAMLGARTKAITVDCEMWRASDLKKLYSLLRWAHGVECVGLSGLYASERLTRHTKTGLALTDSLANFRRLHHFNFETVDCSPDAIKWLASQWPELRTFSLGDDAWISDEHSAESTGPFAKNLHLQTLSLGLTEPASWSAVEGLLVNLPPSLSTLHLLVANAPYPDPSADSAIDSLVAVAPNLTAFHLWLCFRWDNQPAARGLLDRFVARLANVERLTLPACVVTDLAAVLGPLPCLAELVLGGTFGPRAVVCDPRELVELLVDSASLRLVAVYKSIWANEFLPAWTADEKNEVERVAEEKGVEVVWEVRITSAAWATSGARWEVGLWHNVDHLKPFDEKEWTEVLNVFGQAEEWDAARTTFEAEKGGQWVFKPLDERVYEDGLW